MIGLLVGLYYQGLTEITSNLPLGNGCVSLRFFIPVDFLPKTLPMKNGSCPGS